MINVFFPGVGTLIAACMTDCTCGIILVGLAQMFLSFLLVGWIWAIIWSLNLITKAKEDEINAQKPSARDVEGGADEQVVTPPPPTAGAPQYGNEPQYGNNPEGYPAPPPPPAPK